MKKREDPYETADQAIALLNRKAVKRFRQAQSDAAALGFDELNVLKTCGALYEALAADNRQAFLDLAVLYYQNARPHGDGLPGLAWLLEFLSEPDPVTLYAYENEVPRKRDRTAEAVNASPQKAKEFRRGLGFWAQMTAHYADATADHARLKAFKDAGIKEVQWHTAEDEHVCKACGPRDKKIYPIGKVPPKPHWGCRCWLTAVTREGGRAKDA